MSFFEPEIIIEIVIAVAITGSLYALVAAGFTLVYRITKILHLAHGAVVLASGYALWWALAHDSSFLFAVIFALAVSLACGWLMHACVYEHLRKRGKVASTMSLIATLALLILMQNSILALFGSGTRYLPEAALSSTIAIGSSTITTLQLYIIVISLVSLALLTLLLRYSRMGKQMRAVADNDIAAAIVGIPVARVRLMAMLLASLLGGIAGILYAMEFNLGTEHGTMIAIRAFARAIVGGIGSIPGAIVGSFLLEIVENAGAFVFSAGFKNSFAFVVVFFFLFFRPRGIFGERVRREDL